MIYLYLLGIVVGLVLLYYGAEFLVGGAASLALNWGVSPLVAGLTVVAYGTSLPELVVSLRAAFSGESGMALGNIVGSNIFNVGIILGLAALIQPIEVRQRVVRFDIPLMLLLSILFAVVLWSGKVERWMGAGFVVLLVLYTVGQIWFARRRPAGAEVVETPSGGLENLLEVEEPEVPEPSGRPLWDTFLILVGIVLLALGGEALVRGGIGLAEALGISETVIGLTILAAGTSAPELAATVVAALRRHADIAVGNIVGSNVFNILSVVGVASLVHPLQTGDIQTIDIVAMLGVSFLMLPLAWSGWKLNRWEGALLLCFYGVYLYLIWPGSPGVPGLPGLSRP